MNKGNIKAGNCIAGFFLCFMLLPVIVLKAQYAVSGQVLGVCGEYGDLVIEVKSESSVKRIKVSAEGHFITSLNWSRTYRFLFMKTGYVSKVIEFSTELPEDKDKNSIAPYHLPVRLFKTFEGVDTVFFKNPVARIRFDKMVGDFSADRDYSLKVKYNIDKMRREGIVRSSPEKKSVHGIIHKRIPKTQEEPKKQITGRKIVGSTKYTNDNKVIISCEEIKGLPPLEQNYPEGETTELFELKGRIIHRTIFTFEGQRRVFLSVKHEWGGQFYFIDQADIGYRCISRDAYYFSLQKYTTIINVNK